MQSSKRSKKKNKNNKHNVFRNFFCIYLWKNKKSTYEYVVVLISEVNGICVFVWFPGEIHACCCCCRYCDCFLCSWLYINIQSSLSLSLSPAICVSLQFFFSFKFFIIIFVRVIGSTLHVSKLNWNEWKIQKTWFSQYL